MSTAADIVRGFWRLVRDLGHQLKGFVALLKAICKALHGHSHRPERDGECCLHLPPEVYKRPDPLIYDQYYLMAMGLAVTWDNPDIELFEVNPGAPDGLGAPVASSALQAGHPYKVRVRVWNGSYDAPAVGLPVALSYLTFGVATTSTGIDTSYVDLGVKGSPHCPAFAIVDWTTPPVAGHYCLQARLIWPDDANPDNNLGQENVQVATHHSPAAFSFALRNEASVRRRFVIEADRYRLPELPLCSDVPEPERGTTRLAETRERWERARREQGYGSFAVPADWAVRIDPAERELGAYEQTTVAVSVDGTGGIPGGAALNVNCFVVGDDGGRMLAGGVTAYLEPV
jgi:hypothetical protein